MHNKIILFDGYCIFCNYFAKLVLKNDKKNQFRFTSLQSEIGQKILKQCNLSTATFDSFLYLKDEVVFIKSTAALLVFKDLGGIFKILYPLKLFPLVLRDFIYDFISIVRYKIFGTSKVDSCEMIPEEKRVRL